MSRAQLGIAPFVIAFTASCAFDCERLPDASGACGTGCMAANGFRVDEARACSMPVAPFRCMDEVEGHTDDIGCAVRRSDGEIFLTSSGSFDFEDSLFLGCTDEESGVAKGADVACP